MTATNFIDIHAHTSNHTMRDLHTTDATIPALKGAAKAAGAKRVYLMATYFPLKGTGVHNHEMLSRVARDPFFGVFGSLDLTGDVDAGLRELQELLRHDLIAGLKLYPGYQNVSLRSPDTFRAVSCFAEYKKPVMIHTGALHHCCDYHIRPTRCGLNVCPLDQRSHMSHPSSLGPLLHAFPETTFIASHLGYPYVREMEMMMIRHENLYTDIGGTIRTGDDDDTDAERQYIADHIVRIVHNVPNGDKRVLFATDFPIQSYATSLDLVGRTGVDDETKQRIFSKNAEAIGL